jgi:Ca2+-binding RTX toxin-like protein
VATITLTNGNDSLNRIGLAQADTISALEGNDTIASGDLSDFVLGNQGNDVLLDIGGRNTIHGGLGDDSIRATDGIGVLFGEEGADTVDASGSFGVTIVGGLDSTDQADSLIGSNFGDFILGNGGADTINGAGGRDTLVGGFGNDVINAGALGDLIWGNQNNDTIIAGLAIGGGQSVWGGQGADFVVGDGNIFGNEANDTLIGLTGAATLSGEVGNDSLFNASGAGSLDGGAGNDTIFAFGAQTVAGGADGDLFDVRFADNAGTTRITDLNWAQDQLDVPTTPNLDAAGNVGLIDAANLQAAALAAILIVDGGNPALRVAAQFGFLGHTYVAVDQFGGATPEIILDITGVTGTITVGNFLT